MTSPGEGVTVFTYPYLSAGAPAFGEAKGLIVKYDIIIKLSLKLEYFIILILLNWNQIIIIKFIFISYKSKKLYYSDFLTKIIHINYYKKL